MLIGRSDMNDEKLSFEALINEARQAHFSGWDFSWLAGRVDYTDTPWDYRQLVIECLEPHGLKRWEYRPAQWFENKFCSV